MRLKICWRAGIIGATTAIIAGAIARAETCTLQLVRLEPLRLDVSGSALRTDWARHMVACQFVSFPQMRGRSSDYEADGFRSIVKSEPKSYQAERPVRGLTRLGSDQYAFVLDARDATSRGYDRLYFDLNHNGDLTDDKPIDADESQQKMLPGFTPFDPRTVPADTFFHQFPRTDLTINVDGVKTEYAFYFWAVTHGADGAAAIIAGAYRAGEIRLDGKKHKVSLLDFNSNGRFDDVVTFHGGVNGATGPVYAAFGDVLLIAPETTARAARPISPLEHEGRQHVSKLVRIDGRFYEAKISPTGDQLMLTPSSAAVGYVTNPNAPFSGTIYGDQGFLPISAEKEHPATIPEGRWKLLSYSIQVSDWKEPPSLPNEEKRNTPAESERQEQTPRLRTRSQPIAGTRLSSLEPETTNTRLRCWLVSALATGDYQEVTVRGGQTVTLPFGPPYRPVVKASETEVIHGGAQVALWMSLVGSCGEIVQSLTVNRQLPPNPQLVITDPKGETVGKGSFEYRGLLEGWHGWYSWQVPAGAAGDYRIRVKMECGPFQIDGATENVIHVSGPRPRAAKSLPR